MSASDEIADLKRKLLEIQPKFLANPTEGDLTEIKKTISKIRKLGGNIFDLIENGQYDNNAITEARRAVAAASTATAAAATAATASAAPASVASEKETTASIMRNYSLVKKIRKRFERTNDYITLRDAINENPEKFTELTADQLSLIEEYQGQGFGKNGGRRKSKKRRRTRRRNRKVRI
jgi:hypothetical protein